MKQLQLEKLQLLCWSRQGGKNSEAENRHDIVHWGRGSGEQTQRPSAGKCLSLPTLEAFTTGEFLQSPHEMGSRPSRAWRTLCWGDVSVISDIYC